jgi:DNA-binding PadR family transcriptional regulator
MPKKTIEGSGKGSSKMLTRDVIQKESWKTWINGKSRKDFSKAWIKAFTEHYALAYFEGRPDSSGYDLTRHIESEYGFKISYSKIYPLLEQLGKTGMLSVREDSGSYPPKKVYKLTPWGTELVKEYRKGYMHFLDDI